MQYFKKISELRGSYGMICKKCGEDRKHGAHGLCRRCYSAEYRSNHKEEAKQYQRVHAVNNRDKHRKTSRRYRYANGGKSASENRQCALFLGVHIAERVLSKVFRDVVLMPPNYPGFDFVCNRGKKIDVKSACTYIRDKHGDSWKFNICRNQTADFFLCLAFNNREDLTPLHIWLIPKNVINHLVAATMTESNLSKWDEYKLDINKVVTCCDVMKQPEQKKVTR
jgi:hypothetical protein